MTRPILYLDISRLMRRFENFGGPTGIDRVDIAYAHWAATQDDFEPAAVTRVRGGLLALPAEAFATVIAELDRRWQTDAPPGFGREDRSLVRYGAERAAGRLRRWRLLSRATRPDPAGRPSVYLNASQDGLDEPQNYAALPGARAALIHDVIPLTHPEYDTPRATLLHQRRVAALAAHFDHVITNSEATRRDLLAASPDTVRFEAATAHLGPAMEPATLPAVFQAPTFVHLSTINRRKNLAFLLHIWRDLAALPDPPRLAIIGRRGNDGTALELIDRCAALQGLVTMHGALSDREAAAVIAGARALLTPSFAEGFGLPIVEAHLMGVPVIASDLPAHREVGGEAAQYRAPLDGPGWQEAILALTHDDAHHAACRAAIRPPATWDQHFATVAPRLRAIAR
ncbi:MAG: glycosyltransferase family 1 protein [Acuticoccus sp.]